MRLELLPITLREAKAFVAAEHRHHSPPVGWKFGVSVRVEGRIVGVAIAGRPVARLLDDGLTLEVTRCCTTGARNACSMLYASLWRAAKALGYRRLITYTLESESGSSLKASGWKLVGPVRGKSWHTPSRPRQDKAPTCDKLLWEAGG